MLTYCSVPIVGLFIVLLFLHRRNKKKLAAEDAKDKYKSLDFGMEGAGPMRKGKKGGPEMSITEKELRGGHDRGLSLEAGSPYILPVGLHGSRESFHSLSRSHNDPHDPYRPAPDPDEPPPQPAGARPTIDPPGAGSTEPAHQRDERSVRRT